MLPRVAFLLAATSSAARKLIACVSFGSGLSALFLLHGYFTAAKLIFAPVPASPKVIMCLHGNFGQNHYVLQAASTHSIAQVVEMGEIEPFLRFMRTAKPDGGRATSP